MALENQWAYKAEMKRRVWAAERKRRQLERFRETAKVTVVERDGVRWENRGNVPIGFGAAAHVRHN